MYRAYTIDSDNIKTVWSEDCYTPNYAMCKAEELIVDTYGSRSSKCLNLLPKIKIERHGADGAFSPTARRLQALERRVLKQYQ